MYRITKQFGFEAAHRLIGLGDDHPCGRLHGHSYRVELVIEGELDARGFAAGVDYRDLDRVKTFIDGHMDHRTILRRGDPILAAGDAGALGAVFVMAENPTAEALAALLYGTFRVIVPGLVAVRVSETAKTWATYAPGESCP